MNKTTQRALKASINHWRRMSKGKPIKTKNWRSHRVDVETPACGHCSLCRLFWYNDCERCPVAKAVGATCCEKTPYGNAMREFQDLYIDVTGSPQITEKFKNAAKKELKFLESLLPKEND